MNDLELIDEIVRRAEEHQKQKEREFAITELERVKTEIEELTQYFYIEPDVFIILDEHISELKGENNEH